MKEAAGELSVRVDDVAVGGNVRERVVERPKGWLDCAGDVVLLIHGYNNNQDEACEAFEKFRALMPGGSYQIGRFFWPGDADFGYFQWMDFLSYPTEIPDARVSAARLAEHLVEANKTARDLKLWLVGHSLGCRLILELLEDLAGWPEDERPEIKLIMLMAAAVPVELAEDGERLYRAGELAKERLVLYSPDDVVLQWAFPAGQTLAFSMGNEDAVYLEPVGRFGNPREFATETPADADRSGNGHADYWEDEQAAALLARKLGGAVAGKLVKKNLPGHTTSPSRPLLQRKTPEHKLTGANWSVCTNLAS